MSTPDQPIRVVSSRFIDENGVPVCPSGCISPEACCLKGTLKNLFDLSTTVIGMVDPRSVATMVDVTGGHEPLKQVTHTREKLAKLLGGSCLAYHLAQTSSTQGD